MDREFQEYRIKTAAHLAALELMIIRLLVTVTSPLTDEQFEQTKRSWADGLAQETIPGLDPVQSDMLADELRVQVMRVLEGVSESRLALRTS